MAKEKSVSFHKTESGITVDGSSISYKKPARSLWISINSLKVRRTVEFKNMAFSGAFSFTCEATVENGHLSIIGDNSDIKGRKLSLQIHGFEILKSDKSEVSESPYMMLSLEDYKKKYHVSLGFLEANIEFGTEDTWYSEIMLPKKTLLYILGSIRKSRLTALRIKVAFENIYEIDTFAPYSDNDCFYLGPTEKGDLFYPGPEQAMGRVETCFIEENTTSFIKKEVNYYDEDSTEKSTDKDEDAPSELSEKISLDFQSLQKTISNSVWILVIAMIVVACIYKGII